jgi:hypothetical protein
MNALHDDDYEDDDDLSPSILFHVHLVFRSRSNPMFYFLPT